MVAQRSNPGFRFRIRLTDVRAWDDRFDCDELHLATCYRLRNLAGRRPTRHLDHCFVRARVLSGNDSRLDTLPGGMADLASRHRGQPRFGPATNDQPLVVLGVCAVLGLCVLVDVHFTTMETTALAPRTPLGSPKLAAKSNFGLLGTGDRKHDSRFY